MGHAKSETKQELKGLAEESQNLIEIMDNKNDEITMRLGILKRQLELNAYEKNGRRYNSDDFKIAIDLFL